MLVAVWQDEHQEAERALGTLRFRLNVVGFECDEVSRVRAGMVWMPAELLPGFL
jgi:hypothetical protein